VAKIAMFLARSPGPPMTGRKAVIRTAIEALSRDHEVDLFILARPQSSCPWGRQAFWLGAVSGVRMLCNAGLSVLVGPHSLNEALFRSPQSLAVARILGSSYDFAIADTIRAAPYASSLGVPWHLDLDDLLSARYEGYLERAEELSPRLLLGYFRENVPHIASAMPRAIVRRLLRHEAVRLKRRESYWATAATTVSLVSANEAKRFTSVVHRDVRSLPMSVDVPARRWTAGNARHAAPVFLGGLDYKPNLDALLYYQEAVFPLLKASGGAVAALRHIGNAPAELRARFSPEAVRFEGYVDELAPRLAAAGVFVAPIVSGTGIKTKVLEAMALGMPVLATREAVSGLDVEHKKHCFICDGPRGFVEGMAYFADPALAESVGLQARKYATENFSLQVLRDRWATVIRDLGQNARAKESGAERPPYVAQPRRAIRTSGLADKI
jgi:hypothetical protein